MCATKYIYIYPEKIVLKEFKDYYGNKNKNENKTFLNLRCINVKKENSFGYEKIQQLHFKFPYVR